MDIFDTKTMKADMERERDAADGAHQSCHAWSVAALGGFLEAARDVQTPLVALDMDSLAAQASGIALANWPTSREDGKTIARYYSLVRDSSFPVWPAQDGGGLTLALDGRVYLMGNACSADAAATWICQIAGDNLDTAKGVFDSALRGRPMTIA